MTVVFGTLKDVGGQLAQGTVTVASLVTRPAHGSASTVITKERHVLPLLNGAFESPDLDPGPVLIEAASGGAFDSWEVLLPEDGRHDLATLIETHVDYNPSVVGRVEAAAADANRAAQAAGQSATRAADAEHRVSLVVASAADVVRGELQVQIDGATQARVDAQAAQAAAEAAALTVVDDARTQVAALVDELEVSFSDAQELVATASGHAEASAGHAESAAGSAAAARESADAADAAAAVVGGAVEGAEQSAREAAASAADAAGAVSTARGVVDEVQQAGQAALTGLQDHVTAAEAHATAAGTARAGAETARDEAVAAAESATTGAPVGGWQRATLHQDVQDSLSRADTAMQSMPRATGSAPGGVTLAGDLGGTADAPTVPALATKVSVSDVSEEATGQSVPRRTQEGTIRVTTPTSDDDAATKQYVDHQVATAVPPTTGPSDEEMAALWDAVQYNYMITVDTAGSRAAFLVLGDQLAERGLTPGEVVHSPFGVKLTGAGSANQLFQNWSALVRVPKVSGTSQVTSMGHMFNGCSALTTVPALNAGQVTNMQSMFYNCWALTTIPALDTGKVTTMQGMFNGCSALTTVPALNTGQVTTMSSMFSGCSSLTTAPALNTGQVTNMSSMFSGCKALTSVPDMDASQVTTMYSMFNNCSALTTAPALGTSKVTNTGYMFSGCSSLTTIPEMNTGQVTNMSSMFSGCSSLTTAPALNTGQVTNMSSMFDRCSALTTVPALDTSQVTNMYQMFYNCSALTTLPALDTSKVTTMSSMFSGCSSLESVTLPGMGNAFTTKQALDMKATKLNAAAANTLMQSLGTPAPGGTLQLPATAAGADTSIAASKNWTVTIG